MSLMSFIADAGEKLLGTTSGIPTAPAAGAASNLALFNTAAGAAIAKYVAAQHLSAQNLDISYGGASKKVTVKGVAPDQATKEKIALCCGNVHSVATIDDQLTVAQGSATASTMYTVKAGETLSTIARSLYGNAAAFMRLLEANSPMLTDPNKIYPSCGCRQSLYHIDIHIFISAKPESG